MENNKIEKKILREFKNNWAKNKEIPNVYDWIDYINWCKSNGFDESEIGYDDLMIDYSFYRMNYKFEDIK
jgi:hypothetical protein